MIDEGLPEKRSHWPEGVLDSLRSWSQGDVVADPPLFYFADPAQPIWEFSRHQPASEPAVLWLPDEIGPPFGLITSQTCDIAEEDADPPLKPWVQVAPVHDASGLDGGIRKLLRQAKGPRHLLHLPDLAPQGFWIADLRIEVPVEKGWLAQQQRQAGFLDEARRRIVGDRIAYLRQRPALSGRFVRAVQRPLVASLRQLKRDDRDSYDLIDEQVDEVRALVDSRLDTTTSQLLILSRQDLDEAVISWFQNWWDEHAPASRGFGLTLQANAFVRIDELTAAEYIDSCPVPLERISPV